MKIYTDCNWHIIEIFPRFTLQIKFKLIAIEWLFWSLIFDWAKGEEDEYQ